jgi:serine/threonine-protein kinase
MIGETLGGYTIVGRIGAGGMGEVHLAEHTRIERRATIKVLLPERSGNHEVVERFFAEARATSSIRHVASSRCSTAPFTAAAARTS